MKTNRLVVSRDRVNPFAGITAFGVIRANGGLAASALPQLSVPDSAGHSEDRPVVDSPVAPAKIGSSFSPSGANYTLSAEYGVG
jgi:hypothetical protein